MRPGPLQYEPKFVASLNGYSQPEYLFPELEEIYKDTYGVLLYQEQIMRIAIELAGFTQGQGDLYRKSIGKKLREKISYYNNWLVYGYHDDKENIHIDGLVKRGIPEQAALQLADEIVAFGSYSFEY